MKGMYLNKYVELKQVCTKFRFAIEKCKNYTFLFKGFPGGCCRDTSILLNEFLKDKGFEGIEYCSKGNGQWPSHVLLEYKDTIIDLTADQFGRDFASVLILPKQKATAYHIVQVRRKCGFYIAGTDVTCLLKDYDVILKELVD